MKKTDAKTAGRTIVGKGRKEGLKFYFAKKEEGNREFKQRYLFRSAYARTFVSTLTLIFVFSLFFTGHGFKSLLHASSHSIPQNLGNISLIFAHNWNTVNSNLFCVKKQAISRIAECQRVRFRSSPVPNPPLHIPPPPSTAAGPRGLLPSSPSTNDLSNLVGSAGREVFFLNLEDGFFGCQVRAKIRNSISLQNSYFNSYLDFILPFVGQRVRRRPSVVRNIEALRRNFALLPGFRRVQPTN